MEMRIEALANAHDISSFTSGVEPLDTWLKQVAGQHSRKGISRSYAAVATANTVIGYYSLTVTEIDREALPAGLAKKLPRKLPAVLIGRLAVSLAVQGQGVGKALLVDALQRVVMTSEQVGVALILVDAKDDSAARFYEHFGFRRLPEDQRRLALPVATAKAALSR